MFRTSGMLGLAVFSSVLMLAAFAGTAKAEGSPKAVQVQTAFVGYPACVVAGQNAKFPLRTTNGTNVTQTVTVFLTYVTKLTDADPYSTVITNGTDHLSGSFGYEYWQFRLKPGQSVTRTLVTRIQPPRDTKKGPQQYGITELVYISGFPGLTVPVSVEPIYCLDL
jgi:hypothetical protein